MNISIDQQGNSKVAIVQSSGIVIADTQGALDLMADVMYNHGCYKMIVDKLNVTEEFFDLKTRLAGEILQKYTNYDMKIAFIGDFEAYDSKSLTDFIYESNKRGNVFFLKDKQSALRALHDIS